MRLVSGIVKFCVWSVAIAVIGTGLLLQFPSVQRRLGQELSAVVSRELRCYCSIESFNIGYLTNFILDGVLLRDKQKTDMLKAKRIALVPDYLASVMERRIVISTAQLFGGEVNIYKDSVDAPLNCQFVIDALSSDDDSDDSKADLTIRSIILRNTAVAYNLNYMPRDTRSLVDANHLSLTQLSANINLKRLYGDNLDLELRKLAFAEQNGLSLTGLRCDFTLRPDTVRLSDLRLELSDGYLFSDSLVYYTAKNRLQGNLDARFKNLRLRSVLDGSKERIRISNLKLANDMGTLRLNAEADVALDWRQKNLNKAAWRADITDLALDYNALQRTISETLRLDAGFLPIMLKDAGYIRFKGFTEGSLPEGFAKDPMTSVVATVTGEARSALGDVDLVATKTRENLDLSLKANKVQLGRLVSDARLGTLTADVTLSMAAETWRNISEAKRVGERQFPNTQTVNSVLALAKPFTQQRQGLSLKADVKHFDYDGKIFDGANVDLALANSRLKGTLSTDKGYLPSMNAAIDLNVSEIDKKRLTGTVEVNNFRYNNIALERLMAEFKGNSAEIESDVAQISLTGDFDQRRLQSTIHIPDFDKIDKLLSLKSNVKGEIDADLNIEGDSIYGNVESPLISVSTTEIKNIGLGFCANSARSILHSALTADLRSGDDDISVALNTTARLLKNDKGGVCGASVSFHPSQVFLRDTVFHIAESRVEYDGSLLAFDNFTVTHGDQTLTVNGKAGKHTNDSILVDFANVDVPYILDFVDFDDVSFEGRASGHAVVSRLFDKPEARADLVVTDFFFEYGQMGTLYASALWNNEDEQIEFDARCLDGERSTLIDGYVSIARNYIDLNITANRTRGDCLRHYCRDFFSNIDVEVSGEVEVWGDLRFVNLTGALEATGGFRVIALGTDYRLEKQKVEFVLNDIVFNDVIVTDKNGSRGTVNGGLHHRNLSRLTFDLSLEAQNFLAYDIPAYDDQVFFGKAIITGKCDMTGRPGVTLFNIDAKTEKGSFIEYNASNPDAITGQQFISWHNRTAEGAAKQARREKFSSDVRLNVNLAVDDKTLLRVLMDSKTGDHIDLYGSANLKSSYYNKGKFELYGTYEVERGEYRMTIQNLFEKRFQFSRGGQIVFGGDPSEAALNMKAIYTLYGVPLSDLQVGNSFKTNNVRVDCIMDVTGTPYKPTVDLDFDLPTVNANAKEMVFSLINSEQEKRQQVIYLLAFGRFFATDEAADASAASGAIGQTTLAMQSMLSGSLSQKLNSMLGNALKLGNWTFGANIMPGNEGFSNAEYEGTLSGSLFNDRLLINGQFGYRDNKATATSAFIGDFDIRYLLIPNGNIAVRVYNQANDRYFTKASLNTQGLGLILKYDFQRLFPRRRKKKE